MTDCMVYMDQLFSCYIVALMRARVTCMDELCFPFNVYLIIECIRSFDFVILHLFYHLSFIFITCFMFEFITLGMTEYLGSSDLDKLNPCTILLYNVMNS